MFLVRRILICILPALANETNIFPYLILMFLHQVYLIWYGYILNSPHETSRLRVIETINEYLYMLLLCWHLLLTDLAFDCVRHGDSKKANELQEHVSSMILWTIATVFLLNMGLFF